jgi:hypothetical protein
LTLNGVSNFRPVCSVRKSTRLSSGTIQRFKDRAVNALPPEVVDDEDAAIGLQLIGAS